MVTDYWGETPETDGNYEESNSFEVIPEGTRCLSSIEMVKWDSFNGSDHKHINMKLCVEDGEYIGRKFFHSIYVDGTDPNSQYYDASTEEKKKAKARAMMAAIDKNAGGNIFALKRRPTDEDLAKYLIGAKMFYTLGVSSTKKQVVRGVSSAGDITAPSKQETNAKAAASKPVDDDDIPF